MASVEYSAALQCSAEHAWKVIRQFGSIAEWHPAIVASHIEAGHTADSIGAIRRLDLADGGVLRERLLVVDDQRRALAYSFEESALPLDNYRAHITVSEVSGESHCVVQWNATFDVREAETAAHYEALISSLIIEGHNSLALFLQA